jgi:hypothetical protein
MATTNARQIRGGWRIDWVGNAQEFEGLRRDLKSDQAEGVVIGWRAFHMAGDRVRALIDTKGLAELANE